MPTCASSGGLKSAVSFRGGGQCRAAALSVRGRGAEDREHGIALEFVDHTADSLDDLDDHREELVEHVDQFVRVDGGGQSR